MIFLLLILPFLSPAKIYENSFLQFHMPEEWECQLIGTEFVCHHKNPAAAKQAAIVFVGKLIGPQDSLEKYKQHLSIPLHSPDRQQKNLSRIISPPKDYLIKGRTWVDSIHFESEVKDYYTRYLGTVTDQVAVMVTLSVHSTHYSTFGPILFKVADSLLLSEKYKSYLKNIPPPSNLTGTQPTRQEVLGTNSGGFFIDPYSGAQPRSGKKTPWKGIVFVLGVLSALVALFLLWKNRKN